MSLLKRRLRECRQEMLDEFAVFKERHPALFNPYQAVDRGEYDAIRGDLSRFNFRFRWFTNTPSYKSEEVFPLFDPVSDARLQSAFVLAQAELYAGSITEESSRRLFDSVRTSRLLDRDYGHHPVVQANLERASEVVLPAADEFSRMAVSDYERIQQIASEPTADAESVLNEINDWRIKYDWFAKGKAEKWISGPVIDVWSVHVKILEQQRQLSPTTSADSDSAPISGSIPPDGSS